MGGTCSRLLYDSNAVSSASWSVSKKIARVSSPSLFPDVDLPETLRKRALEEEETGSVRNDKDA
jgi:hypothetical protein